MDNSVTRVRELNISCRNTMIDHLGIEFTMVKNGLLTARMPVDHRTIQPMKRLHGGAIMALAETVGSTGSYLITDHKKQQVVGIEINGNHVGNTASDYVTATATILHKGKTIHVWDIRVTDDEDKLVSICRMTNLIMENKEEKVENE
ncbi:MAG: hotdog fold thioesterase [Bacteroidales bacterium]|nr:hotdog fold thioesterase [Bacteroidales bacterium]